MLSKLWGWVALAFGLLGAALLVVAGQRDRAREAATRAKAEAQGRAAVQDAERAIDRARTAAREQAIEEQRNADSRSSDERPSGTFRTDRLRDKD